MPNIDVYTENIKDMILIKVDRGLGMSKIAKSFEKFIESTLVIYTM
jgi:two-component system phosphate regulon sensor histidine kinase PhoR